MEMNRRKAGKTQAGCSSIFLLLSRQHNWLKKFCLEFLHKESMQDYMSELPDAILISIISRLTTLEAAATSILSTRWRHLHAYIDRVAFLPLELDVGRRCKMLCNYPHIIDRALNSHKGAVVKELKLQYLLSNKEFNIKGIFEFVSSKKVEKIDISMDYPAHPYILVLELCDTNSVAKAIEGLSFPHLKELALWGVCIHDGFVGILLSKSPFLECLSISDSAGLENVSIIGHSRLKLRRLDISYAAKLESLTVVDAFNLVSLRCYRIQGSNHVLRLENVPKLTELGISDEVGVAKILSQIPRCVLDQMHTLKLWTSPLPRAALPPHSTLPNLINLRHLDLEVEVGQLGYYARAYSLFCSLIVAWSSLDKLDIKLFGNPKAPNIEQFRERIISTPKIKETFSVSCVECCSSVSICCRAL